MTSAAASGPCRLAAGSISRAAGRTLGRIQGLRPVRRAAAEQRCTWLLSRVLDRVPPSKRDSAHRTDMATFFRESSAVRRCARTFAIASSTTFHALIMTRATRTHAAPDGASFTRSNVAGHPLAASTPLAAELSGGRPLTRSPSQIVNWCSCCGACAQHGRKVALFLPLRRPDLSELDSLSNAVASWLRSRGLKPWDRARHAANFFQYPVVMLERCAQGCVVVNVNPQ